MPDPDGELEIPGSYVRWTVDTRERSNVIHPSSTFVFQSNQWQLAYCCKKDDHLLKMVKSSGGPDAPFIATVHLEKVGTERIVMESLSQKTLCLENNVENVCDIIWSKTKSDIVRSDPEFGRDSHELRFLVELKREDFLAGEECTCATCQFTATVDNVPSLEIFSKDLGDLLTNQSASAHVEFRCAGADDSILTTVKVHKLMVCARSPEINDWFHCDMVASDDRPIVIDRAAGVVTVKGMAKEVFEQLVRYLYSGRLGDTTVDTAMSLYEAGHKLKVESLKKHCARRMVRDLTIENSCDVLVFAHEHEDELFAEATLVFMANREVPLVLDGWEGFCDRHPELSFRVLDRFCKMFKGMSQKANAAVPSGGGSSD